MSFSSALVPDPLRLPQRVPSAPTTRLGRTRAARTLALAAPFALTMAVRFFHPGHIPSAAIYASWIGSFTHASESQWRFHRLVVHNRPAIDRTPHSDREDDG